MHPEASEIIPGPKPDPKKVFVVHGRDTDARDAMYRFLRSLGLEPLEWSQAIALTGKPTPYVAEILEAGFRAAQAVVILHTGDDYARIGRRFGSEKLMPQPRPNVLFEAGMAFALFPNRTIVVQIGGLRGLSDIEGLYRVQLDEPRDRPSSAAARMDLMQRLMAAGCETNTGARVDYLSEGNFSSALISPDGRRRSLEMPHLAIGVALVLAFSLVLAAWYWAQSYRPRMVEVVGEVTTASPVTLYIIAVPGFEQTIQKSDRFIVNIPVLPDFTYRAEYVADGTIVADRLFSTEQSVADLGKFVNELKTIVPRAEVKPTIKDSDKAIERFLNGK